MVTPFGIAWLLATGIVFAVAGWFCIFRTDVMVRMGRRNYEKSRLIRSYPFSDFVLKDSYPAYIRGAGVFVWIVLGAVICLMVFGGGR